jgi:hypothetical protein
MFVLLRWDEESRRIDCNGFTTLLCALGGEVKKKLHGVNRSHRLPEVVQNKSNESRWKWEKIYVKNIKKFPYVTWLEDIERFKLWKEPNNFGKIATDLESPYDQNEMVSVLKGQFEGGAVGHIIDAIDNVYKSSKNRVSYLALSVRS